MQVLVRDNNVDQALKALKKKMQREGIFREMKLRGHYEKPSEKKAREKAEAVRRARKLARKRAQREGLIPMKPKPVLGGPGGGRGGRGGPGGGSGAGGRDARLRRRSCRLRAPRRLRAKISAAFVSSLIWHVLSEKRFPPRSRPGRAFSGSCRSGVSMILSESRYRFSGSCAGVERLPQSLGEQRLARPAAEPHDEDHDAAHPQRESRLGPPRGGSARVVALAVTAALAGCQTVPAALRPRRSRTTSSPPRPPTSPR